MSIWRAWDLDPPTVAILVWGLWFAVWETVALIHHDYDATWTAHLRPLFLAAPIMWIIGFGLWVWFGVHIFLPAVELWFGDLIREGLNR